MSNQQQLPPQQPPQLPQKAQPRLPKPYVATWGVLATVATSYLAVTLMAPSLVGLPAHGSTTADQFADAGQATNTRTHKLHQKLSNAQLEIAKLRTQLSQQSEEVERLVNRQAQTRTAQLETPAATADPLNRPETTAAVNNDAPTVSPNTPLIANAVTTEADSANQAAVELAVAKAQITNAKKTPFTVAHRHGKHQNPPNASARTGTATQRHTDNCASKARTQHRTIGNTPDDGNSRCHSGNSGTSSTTKHCGRSST